MLNAKVALPQATSFVTADLYQGIYSVVINSIRVRSRVYFEKRNPPSLNRNVDSEKLKRRLGRIFYLYSKTFQGVYSLQEIDHSNAILVSKISLRA